MTLPVATVTVTASYLTPDGGAAVGTVTFRPSITPAATDTILPTAITVALVDGALEVELCATDDPAWAAPGWTYTVQERIAGARPRTYSIEVPAASPTLDLATVVPVVTPATVTPYVLQTSVGAPLGVASLDALGQVPFAQLGNAPGGGGGAGDPSSTVTAETSYGTSSSAGAASTYSRGDHTHGTPSLGTSGSTAAAGNHNHSGTYDPAGSASAVASAAASALSAHEADGTNVHGIADTSALATTSSVTSAVSAHSSDTTDVHGIADTSALLTSAAAAAAYQPLDGDLTTLAGLAATTDNMIQSVGSAWASRTPAQVRTALAVAPLASPTFTGTPAAPTASQGTNTTQLATTAYVQTEAGLLVPKSIVDAKGDIIAATAADTVARLAVGANDTVLTADSSTATGLKWATPAGGSGTDYKVAAVPTSGRWHRAPNWGPVGSNLTMVLNRCYFVPFRFSSSFTADRWGCDVATVGSAGAVLRFGIWLADAAGSFPGTLVLDAGTVQADTGTGSRAPTISQALTAPFVWLGIDNQVASGVLLRATVGYDPLLPYFTGANAITGTEAPGSIFANGITGAFASNPTIVDNDRGPILSLRAA